jgi:hypothetical protein
VSRRARLRPLSSPHTPFASGHAQILQLTYDFRLEDSAEERARITATGAVLRRLAESGRGPCEAHQQGYGPLRVWPGGLALSRAIGDRDVGACIVAHPYVRQLRVPETAVRVIIASDGVWDACGNAQVAKPVRRADVEAASKEIVAQALRVRGLRDDTTVICLDLCPDAAPLADHWSGESRAGASGGGGGGFCGLCGGGGGADGGGAARRSGSRRTPTAAVEQLREVDFHPSSPVATASGRLLLYAAPLPLRAARAPGGTADGDIEDDFADEATEHAGRVYAPAGSSGAATPGATEHAGGGFAALVSSDDAVGGSSGGSGAARGLLQRQRSGAPPPVAEDAAAAAPCAELPPAAGSNSVNGGRAGTHHWGESDVAAVFAAVQAAEGPAGVEGEEESTRGRGSRRRGGAGAADAAAAAASDAGGGNAGGAAAG